MELTWESIYVKIIMLKTVITNENGYGGTLKGVLFSSLHSSQAASNTSSRPKLALDQLLTITAAAAATTTAELSTTKSNGDAQAAREPTRVFTCNYC